jgi:DNA repair exonuclease SbcCD ATPase subunit
MREMNVGLAAVIGTLGAFLLSLSGPAAAQKIVCWKDKSGKVVGCGDKVPPEFQSSATKELDKRGITRSTTESVEETNQRRAREQEAAKIKAEEDRKLTDLKRQDNALLETYSNEKEIDLKRDRDLSNLDSQMEQLNTALKGATQRYNEAKARSDAFDKNGKPLPPAARDELAKATADKQRLEQSVQAKQKEKEELRERFANYRRRYTELKSGVQAVPPSQQAAPVAAKK